MLKRCFDVLVSVIALVLLSPIVFMVGYKVAKNLGRNSIGYEIIRDLEENIREKTGFSKKNRCNDLEIIERNKGKYRYVTLDYIKRRASEHNSKNNRN